MPVQFVSCFQSRNSIQDGSARGGTIQLTGPFGHPQEGRLGLWRGQSSWYICGQPRWTNPWHFGPNLAPVGCLRTSGASKTFLEPSKKLVLIPKGPFWPQRALFGAPEVFRRHPEAKFGPKFQRLVHLGWPHKYQVLWLLQGPIPPCWAPQKGL